MATIDHAVLTGTEIHEPKGVDIASLGQVYVADGNGSGNWASVSTSSFTGMIADFTWPVVQDGWLELDGSDISTSTYGGLYDVMTIQMTGTRVSGSPTITSLSSTSNMRVGYYVFGTGIASGTTILSINSGTQITLSGNAASSGTATVVVSPWLLNTGTIKLPDVSTAGRYRRSRTSSTRVGELQDSQNLAHTHAVTGTSGTESATHTHGVSGTTATENQSLSHSHPTSGFAAVGTFNNGVDVTGYGPTGSTTSLNGPSAHNHSFSVTSAGQSVLHTHSINFTSASTGSSEARPSSIVVMTCVKT